MATERNDRSPGEGQMSETLDDIRNACREVASRAVHVRITLSKLSEYGTALPLQGATSPLLDPAHHYLGRDADTVSFVLTLDAINFGSGYFPHLRKRPGLSGYFTIATCLTERFQTHRPFSAEELCRITAEDCAGLFGQDLDGGPRSELMSLFAQALNDLGGYVLDRFSGSFTRLVGAASGSADHLVRILAEMPFYRDVESYGDLRVPFYKRAQLTAADLSLAFGGVGYGQFADIDRLTIFADNLVPHVLRVDGILQYDDALAHRIDQGELLPAGSAEEVEIRACALHAVELLVQSLRAADQDVTAHGLDYLLWNRGQQPYYKARPRHRTRTVYY